MSEFLVQVPLKLVNESAVDEPRSLAEHLQLQLFVDLLHELW